MKKIIYLILIVAIVAIAIGVYIAVQNKTVDETANWQVYENTKYNFKLKHPQEWIISTGDNNSSMVNWSSPDVPWWIMNLKILERNGKTVNKWIQRDQFPYSLIKNINIEEAEGVIVKDPITEGNEVYIAFFPTNNYMFSISGGSVDLLNQILSTLQFTN